jgi:hypothetical protein
VDKQSASTFGAIDGSDTTGVRSSEAESFGVNSCAGARDAEGFFDLSASWVSSCRLLRLQIFLFAKVNNKLIIL